MTSQLPREVPRPRAWAQGPVRACTPLLAALLVLNAVPGVLAAPGAQGPGGAGGQAVPGVALAAESFQAASAVLVDAETGSLLFAKAPHRVSPPASMVKMMVTLIALEQVQAGKHRLDEPVRTSARAEAMGGSQVYLKRNEVFPLEDMLMAVMIGSANDAAVAVAEHTAGSVEGFVDLMNARAQALGMQDTRFLTPHGLPPGRGQAGDVSSPYDMALVARALARHPQALQWASRREAPFRQGTFILRNPNHLLGAFAGLDGLKTGHFREAGYNLTATADRAGLRLVAVVMGEPTGQVRFAEAARLLNWGFNVVRREVMVRAGEDVAQVKVRNGVESAVKGVAAGRVTLFRLPGDAAPLERIVQAPPSIQAPVEAGQKVGSVAVRRGGELVGQTDLVAAKTVPRASLLRRLFFFWR